MTDEVGEILVVRGPLDPNYEDGFADGYSRGWKECWEYARDFYATEKIEETTGE